MQQYREETRTVDTGFRVFTYYKWIYIPNDLTCTCISPSLQVEVNQRTLVAYSYLWPIHMRPPKWPPQ